MFIDRCPLNCIVPPHILDKLAQSGNATLRSAALRAMKQADHLRATREQVGAQPKRAKPTLFVGTEAHASRLFRRVYNAGETETLSGTLVRGEGSPPTGDPAIDAVYDGAGATFKLYFEVLRRNSIDDEGMPIDQTVHYGKGLMNAFWNGEQMIYGDGDGTVFGSFTSDLDIVAHELSHGVIQHEANLRYWFQSGALNESYADVLGTMVKQYHLNQTVKEANWLVGENLLLGERFALRSLKAPGTAYVDHPEIGDDPQPAHMKDYRDLEPWDDNGGVHLNSGIPNHAFYLAAMKVGGKSWDSVGRIWYIALRDHLRVDSTFTKAADAMARVARDDHGAGSTVEKHIVAAWKAVGL
jgi:Zn-dependent metalloprotease